MNKVLFVDDENITLKLIEKKFADTKIKCFFANSGKDAVKILKSNKIDVLITDIMMPDINGLDLVKIAKSVSPKTLRIVLSGNSQVTSIIEAVNTGQIYKYIVKPWRIDDDAIKLVREAVDYAREIDREHDLRNSDIFIDLSDIHLFSMSDKWILSDENDNIIKTNMDHSIPYRWAERRHSIVRTQKGHLKFYDIK